MKNSFKELKKDELVAKRGELRKKYFDFRFQAVVGHVENPVQARNLRRQIARVETLLNAAGKPGTAAVAAPAASAKPARATRAAKATSAAKTADKK
jgi:large subunit ribosomal protein L29